MIQSTNEENMWRVSKLDNIVSTEKHWKNLEHLTEIMVDNIVNTVVNFLQNNGRNVKVQKIGSQIFFETDSTRMVRMYEQTLIRMAVRRLESRFY